MYAFVAIQGVHCGEIAVSFLGLLVGSKRGVPNCTRTPYVYIYIYIYIHSHNITNNDHNTHNNHNHT